MNATSQDYYFAPPVVPHRIRGTRHADLPVGGIEVLVQVHDDRAIFQGRIDELAVIDIRSL